MHIPDTHARLCAVFASVALLLAGCERSAHAAAEAPAVQPFEVRSADLEAEGLGDGPVRGTLAGETFTLAQAVFRIERAERRQRLDIWLSDQPIADCGVPMPTDARKVWLRFAGITDVEIGTTRVDVVDEDPTVSLHYELPDGSGGWRSANGGAAVIVIEEARDDTLRARFSACFDDGSASCVSGAFVAERCTGPLDADDAIRGAGVLSRGGAAP